MTSKALMRSVATKSKLLSSTSYKSRTLPRATSFRSGHSLLVIADGYKLLSVWFQASQLSIPLKQCHVTKNLHNNNWRSMIHFRPSKKFICGLPNLCVIDCNRKSSESEVAVFVGEHYYLNAYCYESVWKEFYSTRKPGFFGLKYDRHLYWSMHWGLVGSSLKAKS